MNTFEIHFDGGFTDQAYGSWEVLFNGFRKRVSRVKFVSAEKQSSNVAEYLSLIAALSWLQSVQEKKLYRLEIYTDSMLLSNQVAGGWQCRTPRLQVLLAAVKNNLAFWGSWRVQWHSRINNVSRFGH